MPVIRLTVVFICPSCKSVSEFASVVYIRKSKELRDCVSSVCPNCLEAILPEDVQSIAYEPDNPSIGLTTLL